MAWMVSFFPARAPAEAALARLESGAVDRGDLQALRQYVSELKGVEGRSREMRAAVWRAGVAQRVGANRLYAYPVVLFDVEETGYVPRADLAFRPGDALHAELRKLLDEADSLVLVGSLCAFQPELAVAWGDALQIWVCTTCKELALVRPEPGPEGVRLGGWAVVQKASMASDGAVARWRAVSAAAYRRAGLEPKKYTAPGEPSASR